LPVQVHHRIVIDAARIGNAEQQRRLGAENDALAVEPEVRGQYEAPGDRQIEVIETHLVDATLAGFDARVARQAQALCRQVEGPLGKARDALEATGGGVLLHFRLEFSR
jgi:hypothetical protein